MLEDARAREASMRSEYDRRTREYELKVLQNDGIRRQLEQQEKDLKKLIPTESFIEGSEWHKVVEEIRVLERLVGED